MNKKLVLNTMAAAVAVGVLTQSAFANPVALGKNDHPDTQAWFESGQDTLKQNKKMLKELSGIPDKAKNVVLFVGDGMGISTLTAARIRQGQVNGESGEENFLSFENPENFPFVALSKTYTSNMQTPDSAGTMTAIMTGVKTNSGVVNVSEAVAMNDCSAVSGNELVPSMALAELAGKSTGIVTTTRLTHATPAGTYAVSPSRDFEDDSRAGSTCGDIAYQMVNFGGTLDPSRVHGPVSQYSNYMDGFEVMLGGGKRHFIGKDEGGKRKDGQNLVDLWSAEGNENWAFVEDKTALSAVDAASTEKLLGFFNSSHMNFEADRAETEEPSLAEMTDKALDVLSKNDDGFFLMVEGGRIDHAHHSGNAYRALAEAAALSDAVELTLEKLEEAGELDDTLIIVTADHSHTMTIAGYPKRGNPILGRSVNVDDQLNLDLEGNPYTTLGYINGGGYAYEPSDASFGELQLDRVVGRQGEALADLEGVDTEGKNYFQEALVSTQSAFAGAGAETHAGEDVAIYAQGPLAYKFQGTLEENSIFHVINEAAELEKLANEAVSQR